MLLREAREDELVLLRRLHRQIVARAPRNSLRSRFVDTEERLKVTGFTVPASMDKFEVALNWPSKAVSSFTARQVPTGFATLNDTSLVDDIEDVYADNNFETVDRGAIEAAAEHGCSFIFTSLGDLSKGEAEIVKTARTALTATAEVDPRTRRVTAAMELLDGPRVLLHLPNRTLTCVRRPATWWIEDEVFHDTGGRVMCAPYVHGWALRRPLGKSRVTQAVMDITYAGARTLLRQEVAAEFFQAPRLAMMGVDESIFRDPVTGRQVSPLEILIGSIWAIPDVHPDDEPDVPDDLRRAGIEQISQLSMQPFSDQFRLLAGAMSSASSLPPFYLGVMQDSNPTSAQAIEASEIDLVREVGRQNASLAHGRREDALNTLAALYGPLNEFMPELRKLRGEFEDPRTRSMSEMSQMTALQVQAGNLQPGTKTTLRQLPLSPASVDAAVEENRKAAGSGILDRVLEGDGPEEPTLSERATTFGTLIRAGATPESAAAVAAGRTDLADIETIPGFISASIRQAEE